MSLSGEPAVAAPVLATPYDFDGNGYPDLAIGAPAMRVGSVRGAGGVTVLPASKKGLSLREKVITQSSRGVPGASEKGDQFGFSTASADFNRDGFADLAVGQPGEKLGAISHAGTVTVVYGSRKGLDTSSSVAITQAGGARSDAAWGQSLAAADFDIDGYPDLAVGAPSSIQQDTMLSGTVSILPGSVRGLGSNPVTVLTAQQSADPSNYAKDGDVLFGAHLTTGDLDGDHDADLVVVSKGGLSNGDWYPGSVTACFTQPGRLGGCRRLLHDDAGFAAVAIGNVSGDSVPEIVITEPTPSAEDQEAGSAPNYGYVTILHLRNAGGISVALVTYLWEDSSGVPGSANFDDGFGSSVAVGDIDRDGFADLVVGAPGANYERGRATVIHGARSGYRTGGNYSYTQNTKGIPGKAERRDLFGGSLTLLDHNRDGRLDLTVGAPGENKKSGVVTTLPGSGKQFSTSRSRTFGLSRLAYRHPGEAQFGASLGRS